MSSHLECPAPRPGHRRGGAGGTCPRIRSITQTPRTTGDVLVPLADTFNTLAWLRNPPRTLEASRSDRTQVGMRDVVDLVVLGQPSIEHCEIGLHEIRDREIVFHQLVEERSGFFDHRESQKRIKLRIKLLVGIRKIDVAQIEPGVSEIVDEAIEAIVVESNVRFALAASSRRRPAFLRRQAGTARRREMSASGSKKAAMRSRNHPAFPGFRGGIRNRSNRGSRTPTCGALPRWSLPDRPRDRTIRDRLLPRTS